MTSRWPAPIAPSRSAAAVSGSRGGSSSPGERATRGHGFAMLLPGSGLPWGQPQHVHQQPAHADVAVLLGDPGPLGGGVELELRGVELAGGNLPFALSSDEFITGQVIETASSGIDALHQPPVHVPMLATHTDKTGALGTHRKRKSKPAPSGPFQATSAPG